MPAELIAEARSHPNGFVYEIDESMVEGDAYNDAVPPEAIVGAWAVDERGELTGEFTPKPQLHGNAPAPRRLSVGPPVDVTFDGLHVSGASSPTPADHHI